MNLDGQYLTYDEYLSLDGSLEEAPFALLEFQARQNIDNHTYNRIKYITPKPIEVKMCVFRLITLLNSYKQLDTQNKGISSESIDGYNVSYSNASNEISKAKASEVKNIIEECLSNSKLDNGTPYLYRG